MVLYSRGFNASPVVGFGPGGIQYTQMTKAEVEQSQRENLFQGGEIQPQAAPQSKTNMWLVAGLVVAAYLVFAN